MLVFGVDVPLIEVMLVFAIIIFILLVEALVIIILMTNQVSKTRKLGELIERLSETLLHLKRAHIEEIDKRKK